ncbi:Holliday junction resolvase RecU [Bacillus cereus]|uniref:Holliday junction resolvase RecU n=1 Tax=Bacillus cereus TaxID=1396 RepID=UPI0018CD947B|nr:Holliday junction resolvase RecU [Bacillus cereus]MBG9612207.1 recombinase RecU [Bacillus cereus]
MEKKANGLSLEHTINQSNEIYQQKSLALITKRPTPVQVLKSKGRNIVSGLYVKKSTVDYEGVYNGYAVAFEAKSTMNSNSFPLKNIREHQVLYLEQAEKMGALCFFLLEFRTLNIVYLMPFNLVNEYIKNACQGGRKSIPLDECNLYGYKVQTQQEIPLDYLPYVDELIKHQKCE